MLVGSFVNSRGFLRRSSALDHWEAFKKRMNDIEALMKERFDALNDEFDGHIKLRASAESLKGTGSIAPHHYSRSVTLRSFQRSENCWEEMIVEQNSQTSKVVKKVTHIGDRSVQTRIRRHRLAPEEDAAFVRSGRKWKRRYVT
jgi:hypothetical protein